MKTIMSLTTASVLAISAVQHLLKVLSPPYLGVVHIQNRRLRRITSLGQRRLVTQLFQKTIQVVWRKSKHKLIQVL